MDRSIFITSIPSLIINNPRRYKTNADCIALHLLPHSCVVISKYTGEVLACFKMPPIKDLFVQSMDKM